MNNHQPVDNLEIRSLDTCASTELAASAPLCTLGRGRRQSTAAALCCRPLPGRGGGPRIAAGGLHATKFPKGTATSRMAQSLGGAADWHTNSHSLRRQVWRRRSRTRAARVERLDRGRLVQRCSASSSAASASPQSSTNATWPTLRCRWRATCAAHVATSACIHLASPATPSSTTRGCPNRAKSTP